MKSIINFSIKNKLAIWIITIFIIVFGLYSANSMKMEQLPNINEPMVSVQTVYPGASPEEIEDTVTEPIEKQILNLEGVKNVTSTTLQDASSVQVEYSFDKDMKEAEREIENAIKSIILPDKVMTPEVARLSFNDLPVLVLSLTDNKRPLEKLEKLVQDDIKPEFEKVQGISKVNVVGNGTKEVQISFLPKMLQRNQMKAQDVYSYLKSVSGEKQLGVRIIDGKEKILSINNEINSIKKLEELDIPTPFTTDGMVGSQNQPSAVKLKDIAKIETVKTTSSISRYNGKESIGLQINQAVNGNTVDIVDGVKKKMDQLENKHTSIAFSSVLNSGDPIKDSVHMMFSKALMGAAFAILIILLFLRDLKSTIIAVVSIPLSLVIAIIMLKQMDITLNLMTLGAMTVAIGRVVDDSIVVIENIYRKIKLEDGKLNGLMLIKSATLEMFSPIMSSTIVTIAVFLPLGLINGPVGELFFPFGLTIVFALLASLLVAITIVPMMAHLMLRKSKTAHAEKNGQTYQKVLNWSLNHKIITFVLINALLIGSLFLIPAVGVTFMPEDENNMLIVTYDPRVGDTKEQIDDQVKKAEDYLLNRKHIELVQSSQGGGNPLNPADTRQVLFFIKYKKGIEDFEKEQQVISKSLKGSSTGEWNFQNSGAGNNQMNIFVYGDDFESINAGIKKIEKKLAEQNKVQNIKSSASVMLQKLSIHLDPKEVASLGVPPEAVYDKLGGGNKDSLTTFEIDGEKVPVMVNLGNDLKSRKAILDEKVQSLGNESINVNKLVKVNTSQAPATITKRNGQQYGEITAAVKSENVGKEIKGIEKEIKNMSFAKGVNIEFGGVSDQINESFNQLFMAVIIAIAVVFFVLVVTFGGGLAPLSILFSLPYAVIGSVAGLLLTKEPISISVMIGALMLIGIVVTNAIVLVDRITQNERLGMTMRESIIEAGGTRLRPILMTALATVGALSPLVLSGESDGSGLISRGLGVTVIGGLISSTILTLIVVPVVYETLVKIKRKFKKIDRYASSEEENVA
ncbi:efflux RND transporter permease subunit [Peribacillus simplex]|uniref:efflux RND transporter permease subunit n=1 Tax=Peribacillus simplex TaxID=1478 RepID=UPI000F62E1E0|nr:efflux RND transporter permease subunit [Peribacillus simplex]RRN69540.1 efflux RND transporter permease subunit [Peribacillus simplex]